MNETALKIIKLLYERCGFDDWWDIIDEDVKEEIISEITEVLK
jgi:hypothetical protein